MDRIADWNFVTYPHPFPLCRRICTNYQNSKNEIIGAGIGWWKDPCRRMRRNVRSDCANVKLKGVHAITREFHFSPFSREFSRQKTAHLRYFKSYATDRKVFTAIISSSDDFPRFQKLPKNFSQLWIYFNFCGSFNSKVRQPRWKMCFFYVLKDLSMAFVTLINYREFSPFWIFTKTSAPRQFLNNAITIPTRNIFTNPMNLVFDPFHVKRPHTSSSGSECSNHK